MIIQKFNRLIPPLWRELLKQALLVLAIASPWSLVVSQWNPSPTIWALATALVFGALGVLVTFFQKKENLPILSIWWVDLIRQIGLFGVAGGIFTFFVVNHSTLADVYSLSIMVMTLAWFLPLAVQKVDKAIQAIPPRYQSSFEIRSLEQGRVLLQRSQQEQTPYHLKLIFRQEEEIASNYLLPKEIILPIPESLHSRTIKEALLAAVAYFNEQARAQSPIHLQPTESYMTFSWMMGPRPNMGGFRSMKAEKVTIGDLNFQPVNLENQAGQLLKVKLTELLVFRAKIVISDTPDTHTSHIKIVA